MQTIGSAQIKYYCILKRNIMMAKTILIWGLRILAALILLQTLYFKFTAQPESVQLFTTLGMEPWGRIGTGVAELIAAILILIPRTTLLGALMGLGLMSGAIFFHLTKLGINFGGDATLFAYAVITFSCCLILIIIYRKNIPQLLKLKF
ncbi:MAG: DoxX family protein [Ferruginibacter sp.]